MSNMSYCRFYNTLGDLQDCRDNFDEIESEEEKKYAIILVKTCRDIVSMFNEDEPLEEQVYYNE